MRRFTAPAIFMTAALIAGCNDQSPSPTEGLRTDITVLFSKADPKNAHTHLDGQAEVPVRETSAQGHLKLQLSPDGETLSYTLIASNIDNVFQAHLHLGPADGTGPVVVWLYPSAPPAVPIPGRHNGVLASGEITGDSLVGELAGESLSTLIEEIMAGNIYANVHTNDFVDPANTGPGDFPGGEIRGQVQTGG
jgi:hypothetical protein